MYDAVVTLLTDLQLGECDSQDVDEHTRVLVGGLCEHFVRLEITGMRLSQNGLSDHATIMAVSNNREIVLARLTSSELMNSTADLAAHLLHMLRFQSPRLRSTPTAAVDDTSPQTTPTAQENYPRSWTVDNTDSQMTVSSSRQDGVTYPSALRDVTNISGCFIPISRS